MAELYNKDAERPYLSALIKNPSLRADTEFLKPLDLSPEANRAVLSAIDGCLASGIEVSEHSVIDRLNSLGIKLGGVLDPATYITHLSLIEVSDKAAIERAKEIKRWTVRREIYKAGEEIVALMSKDDKDKRAIDMVNEATAAFNRKVGIVSGMDDDEPIDLFGTIDDCLVFDDSVKSRSIIPPWPIFRDLYGYWDPGTAPHLFVSRMKIGKSSLWLSGMREIAVQDVNDEFRVLVLDTELTAKENQWRTLAAISGVDEFRIRHGWYRENPEHRRKVDEAREFIKPYTKRLSHKQVGGKNLDEILSIARRWARKTLTKGKRGLIVYDYIKLNSANDFKSASFALSFGEKMDAIKNLGIELDVPTICFAQTNRENVESKAGDKQRSTAVVGGSDMLTQFASNVMLLEELTPDERVALNQLGPDDATHSLREIALRQQGPNDLKERGSVKYKDEKGKDRYCKNYLLFNFTSFRVKEVSTLKRVMERNQTIGVKIQPNTPERGEML